MAKLFQEVIHKEYEKCKSCAYYDLDTSFTHTSRVSKVKHVWKIERTLFRTQKDFGPFALKGTGKQWDKENIFI